MKRILVLFVLGIFLVSCGKTVNGNSSTANANSSKVNENSSVSSFQSVISPQETNAQNLGADVNEDPPEDMQVKLTVIKNPAERVIPDVQTVVPLQAPADGAVFYDAKAQKHLTLPAGLAKYRNYKYCYIVIDSNNRYAVMSNDGKLLTGFKYDFISDRDIYSANNRLAVMEKSLYGVIDAQNGKEVLPAEYTKMEFLNDLIRTENLEQVTIFDYSG